MSAEHDQPPFAVGTGYDTHILRPHRKLILGGIEIEHERGLHGHSDADVLLHAIMDALLGAAGLPDIGVHFPPSDEAFRDADSRDLLRQVMTLIREAGWKVGNIDSVLIAEEPKLSPYIPAMKAHLAKDIGVPPQRVGIKATTNEKMGSLGRGEGIACIATALLIRDS